MTIHIFDRMRSSNRRLLILLLLVTAALGFFEGFYGRTRYSADAINYLNIVRALHAADWKLALNPYWGLGYPLLIAAITSLFPATPAGEWIAIHVLNLIILMATFFSFYWLVWTAARTESLQWMVADQKAERFLLLGAFGIFLSIELSMDNVSRVGPDMLVTCLVFAACTLLIKLCEHPNSKHAIALGLVLGLGYVVKTIFLPLTLVFAFVLVLALWKRRRVVQGVLLMLAAAAIFAVPYIAGLSWAAGHLTYGESGSLNYAWNVNKLEPGGLWQGGKPYGTPIHPAQMVSTSPHIYLFNGPFPVTFGPFFNPPYYYQGYRHFINLKAQVHEAAGNGFRLVKILSVDLVLYALIIVWLIHRRKSQEARNASRSVKSLWPLLVVSAAGVAMYLLVYVEARYIASFLAMSMLVLLFAIVAQIAAVSRSASTLRGVRICLAAILVCCFGSLLITQKDADRNVFGHAIHHQIFSNDDQWKAGLYLQQTGLNPADKVAVMSDLVSATRANWAYIDRLQIVGILGGSLLETQTTDFDQYWSADSSTRQSILNPFKAAGAKLVFAYAKPATANPQGWQPIPNTPYWIYKIGD